jgi:hypothetical protein
MRSLAHAAVVRREYDFSDDLLKVELRQALEFYLTGAGVASLSLSLSRGRAPQPL